MKTFAAIAFAVAFIGLVSAACTVTANPSSPVTAGTPVTFTLNPSIIGSVISCACGDGISCSNSLQTQCTYQTPRANPYGFRADVEDTVTGLTETCTFSMQVDQPPDSPPTVSISAPTNNEVLPGGQQFVFRGSASDDIGLSQVQLVISCPSAGTYNIPVSGTQADWSYSWPVPSSSRSGCTAQATAKDSGSKQSTPASVSFNTAVSATPTPLISCAVVKGSGVVGQPAQISVSYSGISSPTLTLSCGNGASVGGSCGGSSCAASCQYSSAGIFAVGAAMGSVNCAPSTITISTPTPVPTGTVAPSATAGPTATATATPTATAGPTASAEPHCTLAVDKQTVATPGSAEVTFTYYTPQSTKIPSVQIRCGNGAVAQASNCLTGACKTICSYSSETSCVGKSACTLTASAAGLSCSATLSLTKGTATATPAKGFEGLFGSSNVEANVSVVQLATFPSVVIENQPLKLSAVLSSDKTLEVIGCDAGNNASSCACSVSGETPSLMLDCAVQPPVKGKYVVTLLAADGLKKEVAVMLEPGKPAVLAPKAVDIFTMIIQIVIVVLVAGAILFGALAIREKLPKDVKGQTIKRKQEAQERLLEIDEEFKTNKMLFMKGKKTIEQYRAFNQEKTDEKTELISEIKQINDKLEKMGVKQEQ